MRSSGKGDSSRAGAAAGVHEVAHQQGAHGEEDPEREKIDVRLRFEDEQPRENAEREEQPGAVLDGGAEQQRGGQQDQHRLKGLRQEARGGDPEGRRGRQRNRSGDGGDRRGLLAQAAGEGAYVEREEEEEHAAD